MLTLTVALPKWICSSTLVTDACTSLAEHVLGTHMPQMKKLSITASAYSVSGSAPGTACMFYAIITHGWSSDHRAYSAFVV